MLFPNRENANSAIKRVSQTGLMRLRFLFAYEEVIGLFRERQIGKLCRIGTLAHSELSRRSKDRANKKGH